MQGVVTKPYFGMELKIIYVTLFRHQTMGMVEALYIHRNVEFVGMDNC